MPEDATTTTPPAPAAPSTRVTVGGRTFELRNMSVADGTALYNALTPEQRARADQMAATIRLFQSIVEIDLPLGMDLLEAFSRYTQALERGGGQLARDADSWMPAFGRAIEPYVRGAPGYDEAASALDNARNALNTLQGVAESPNYVLGMPFRLWDALVTTWREGTGAVGDAFGGRSLEQARALAAAYVALEAEERVNRPAPTVWSLSNIGSTLQAGWDWVYNNNFLFIPQLFSTIWRFCCQFVGRWTETGNMPDIIATWNNAWNGVGGEISQSRSENGHEWGRLFQSRVQQNENPAPIINRLVAAENIAGIPTRDIAPLLGYGGSYQARDGSVRVVGPEGRDGDRVRTNPDTGQPDTRGSRLGETWRRVVDTGDQAQNTASGVVAANAALSGLRHFRIVDGRVPRSVPFLGRVGLAGLRRVAGPVVTLWEGQSAVAAANEGDMRGALTHGASATTAAVSTACLFFGPIGWGVAGVLMLADVTGATEWAVGGAYDLLNQPETPAPDGDDTRTRTTRTDARTSEGDDRIRIAADGIPRGRDGRPVVFASIDRTMLGGLPAGTAPSGTPQGVLPPSVFATA